ncbi:MAG: ATP-binding protein [Acidobacteriota bacterium]
MPRRPLTGLTIRAAVILGFTATVAVWVFTGYAFTRRIDELERDSAAVTARYMRAQDALVTVRAQMLLSSVQLRDALLDTDTDNEVYARRLRRTYASLDDALRSYTPVLDTPDERAQLARLQAEVDTFRRLTFDVLAADDGTTRARELLDVRIVPRREGALRLSEDIQVLNRTAFVQHQAAVQDIHDVAEAQVWQRLGLALSVSLLAALIAAVYSGRLERRLTEQREKEAEAARELQRLSSRLITAQEDERRVIARELHDEVGQVLTAVRVELSRAERALAAHGEPGLLVEAQAITEGALRSVRDLSQLLHPSVLDDMGLAAAVERHAKGQSRRHGIEIHVVHDGVADVRLAPDVEAAAYRIVQEALTNVVRHARATRCTVTLRRADDRLLISVDDDGRGFPPDDGSNGRPRGLGLVGMRERAAQVGGSLRLASVPGDGTRLSVELPLQPRQVGGDEAVDVPPSVPAASGEVRHG